MRWVLCCAAALAAACLPPIPKSAVAPGPPAARGTGTLCRLTGETLNRPLLFGVADFSFQTWHSVIGTVVVRRPEGMLVIDPAFGTSIEDDLKKSGLFFKLIMGSGHGKTPVVQSMDAAGIDPYAVKWIALTHAHWDHTGAIRDLARAQVKLSRAELEAHWNLKGHVVNGAMPHHLAVPEGRFAPFDFDGPPLLGFESSHDLFGDGSVVAVPTPGHTPGSASYLVRGDDGKAWFFIGDATWTVEGVKRPAHKNPLVSAALDHDTRALAQTLAKIHAVGQLPDITVVPAHDLAAFGQLPECTR